MPIPIIFIGIAAVTGAIGVSNAVKGGVDQKNATKLNSNTTERLEEASFRLDTLRKQCGKALDELGEEKIFVLNGSVQEFLAAFEQLKNVDFRESEGLRELSKLQLDQVSFEELAEMKNFAVSIAKGSVAGLSGGAIAALGAYGLAAKVAVASTGTAISTLSGAAASNATLAFFGGGSLAAGGMGMAGGTAVLGGLVAGPALMVMGTIISANAGKNLENAKANAAMTSETIEELENGAIQCIAIRRRTYMFYSLLARMDAYFLPQIYAMEKIIAEEGVDYSQFKPESKAAIAAAASTAATIKAILDTPILTEKGELTEESNKFIELKNREVQG